jgi:hypothetical protein
MDLVRHGGVMIKKGIRTMMIASQSISSRTMVKTSSFLYKEKRCS